MRSSIFQKGSGLFLLLLMLLSCGKSSSKSQDPAFEGGGFTPVPPSQPMLHIAGRVVLGPTHKVAEDVQLWVADYTEGHYKSYNLNSSGDFAIPINSLRRTHHYSLHLIQDRIHIAGLNFASSMDTPSPLISYEGGYGFYLGVIQLPLNAAGQIDLTAPPPEVTAGSSFRIVPDTRANLNVVPTVQGIKFIKASSSLAIHDASTLLHAFYRRNTNAALYTESLSSSTQVLIEVAGKDDTSIVRTSLQEDSAWTGSSRITASDETKFSDAPRWSTRSYEIPKTSSSLFLARVFSTRILSPNTILSMRIQMPTGPLLYVPRVLGPSYITPPMLRAISLGDSSSLAINYFEENHANGLTHPFCLTDRDVQVTIDPPLEQTGNLPTDPEGFYFDLSLNFYSISSGSMQSLAFISQDFAPPWGSPIEDTLSDSSKRTWSPSEAKIRIESPSAQTQAGVYNLTIPRAAFLNQTSSGNTDVVQMKMSFQSKSTQTQASSIAWFRVTGC